VKKKPLLYGFSFLIISLLGPSCRKSLPGQSALSSDIRDFYKYQPDRAPYISVHRGGGELAGLPENAIESFSHYAALFPAIIECDIELSKDSVLVMMHDNKLDRTTNGTGKISDYTLTELKKLRLKDKEGNISTFAIPTLEEVLLWAKNKVYLNLDYKKQVPSRMVVDMVKKHKAQTYAAIITYNANQAIEVHKMDSTVALSVSIMQQKDYNRLHELGLPDHKMVAFIGTREPQKSHIDFLHSKGIMCILGTLGNLDQKAKTAQDIPYKTWAEMGVDIFATDRPEAIKKTLKPKY
jgi:glycerophosphoryl diester phosphodiesterase